MFDEDRLVVMRAADVTEKVSRENPHYLNLHKKNILKLLLNTKHIEFKWHLVQLIPRLNLNSEEFTDSWQLLVSWLKNKTNSRIVKVSSLQSLFEMANQNKNAMKNFKLLLPDLKKENIPSINARLRNLKL